jgi:amidase
MGTVTSEIAGAVRDTAHRLERFGHTVEEGGVPDADVSEFLPLWQRLIAVAPVLTPYLLQPVTRWLHGPGKSVRAADVKVLHERLQRRVVEWFGDADVWLTPTVPVPPPRIGAWRDLPPDEAFAQAAVLGAFTAAFNISGQPAVSVPAGRSAAGHPIGIQLAGPAFGEGTLLALARQLEQDRPWQRRAPT